MSAETILLLQNSLPLRSKVQPAQTFASFQIALAIFAMIFAGLTGARASDSTGDNSNQADLVRGVVRPRMQASISSELAAPVARITFKEGDSFATGVPLIVFDCRTQEAELDAAAAEHREMEISFENAKYLSSHRAGGTLEVELARARVAKAAARLSGVTARLTQCSIAAPFDGRVAELAIHEHETPVAGRPVITVIETANPEIELIVPSSWLRWLENGQNFEFKIDETGSSLPAQVVRIGATVDPVSQTIKVFGTFAKASDKMLAGMSGTAQFVKEGN